MKIDFEKSRVIFNPENADETSKLEALWKIMVDCVGFNKKLVPIGEFVPQKNNKGASFVIEGPDEEISLKQEFVEVRVNNECQCYCKICNKLISLKEGDVIPICCGKMMEVLD